MNNSIGIAGSFFVAVLCGLFGKASYAQQLDFAIAGLQSEKVYLSAVSGENITRVDSFSSLDGRRVTFTLEANRDHIGVYRLSFGRNIWFDFISDGEDVSITTDATAPAENLNVISSQSNQVFISFLRLNKQYKAKSELLQLVLARYPKDDPYYTTTVETARELQKMYREFTLTESQKNRNSFAARYVRSAALLLVNFNQPLENQLTYLKAHALDSVDFTDEGLIHSDLFTNKSIEYLTYYRNPQLPKELLEKEFNIAVDTILSKAKINKTVYKHITEYLIDGFKKFGFEKCIEYILDNYVIKDDLCLDQASGSSIQKMIDQKKYLPIGVQAPDITLPDSTGKLISLSSLKAEKILIVFYASDCPHCQSMLPKLVEFNRSQKKGSLQIMAISLDRDRTDWLNFVRNNKLDRVNVNDPASWGGTPATQYYLFATPSMFLIDKDGKIVAKPLTIEELRRSL